MEYNTQSPDINEVTLVAKANREVNGFEAMYRRFERSMLVHRSQNKSVVVLIR